MSQRALFTMESNQLSRSETAFSSVLDGGRAAEPDNEPGNEPAGTFISDGDPESFAPDHVRCKEHRVLRTFAGKFRICLHRNLSPLRSGCNVFARPIVMSMTSDQNNIRQTLAGSSDQTDIGIGRDGRTLTGNAQSSPRESMSPMRGVTAGEQSINLWAKIQRLFSSCRGSCSFLLKDPKHRSVLLSLVISGILFASVLSTYVALCISNRKLNEDAYVLFVFSIMILGVIFGHHLGRILLILVRGPKSDASIGRIPSIAGPSGYAQPERPIHVILARDEEMMVESDGPPQGKVARPPPAYGLWRSSVRIDPNLLFWQRVDDTPLTRIRRLSEEGSSSMPDCHRPPSYISDEGVNYVVDAQPRSTALRPLANCQCQNLPIS